MSAEVERLQRLLGGPGLIGLRRRLRARYERGDSRDELTLTNLSAAERRALEGLLGKPSRAATTMRVRRTELDAAISQAGLAADLRGALIALDGPIHDLNAARAAHEQAWRDLLGRIDEPRIRALVSDVVGGALLKRLSAGDVERAATLLAQAKAVLKRLPARGIPLARLAAEVLGDSHALDAGKPAATLVLRTCAADTQLDADERVREQWMRLGVTVNELARPALALNLCAHDDSSAATLARAAASQGEPVHLSLRALLRQPPAWDVAGRDVFVCENPAVVAIAADALGATSAPLVCTEGMPAAAQRTLLAQLAGRGGQLRYHGDFDWPGLAVGNFVMRTFGAAPWRFGLEDYLAAACPDRGGLLTAAGRVEAAWDARLSAAMAERLIVVHEEAVADVLLRDLQIDLSGA